jgi:NADPH:quinone reductase-like Zn-dependent oxidoreductase
VVSTAKLDAVRRLGADRVVDYTREDFLGHRGRYDVIIDIAGNRRLPDLRRALTPHGWPVITGGETDGRLLGGSDRQLRAQLLSPFVSQKLGTFIASENAAGLEHLRELVESGAVAPVLDRTCPLADTAAAVRRLLAGRTMGKLAICVP